MSAFRLFVISTYTPSTSTMPPRCLHSSMSPLRDASRPHCPRDSVQLLQPHKGGGKPCQQLISCNNNLLMIYHSFDLHGTRVDDSETSLPFSLVFTLPLLIHIQPTVIPTAFGAVDNDDIALFFHLSSLKISPTQLERVTGEVEQATASTLNVSEAC